MAHPGQGCARSITELREAALRLEAIGRGELPSLDGSADDGAKDVLGRVIGNLDSAITTLAERVALGVYETFAMHD
jgi:hypothetical protein